MKQETKSPNLYRIKPETSKGRTVRQACYDACQSAKKEGAVGVAIIMKLENGNVRSHYAGLDWIERVGVLEIAKTM